ncbi:MAG TPA: hypothetical protein VMF32_20055 [Xanthobacteraceae bacterium]|nr:hypothetical protein [Xanthobacteraceae bacterium]
MKAAILLGLIGVAIGLLVILLSLGLLGSAASSKPPENSWLGVAFGIAFLFAGISAIIQAVAVRGYPTTAELPASSPTWLRSLHTLLGLGVIISMGSIFTWIAVGPGKRAFTGSGAIFGETVGRIAFGVGAMMFWFALGVFVFTKLRRLFSSGKNKNTAGTHDNTSP